LAFYCSYAFSKSLPQGQYHFRVNISNDTVSALSDTFIVNSAVFNCLHPPTWKNVISTSDPNYHSLSITFPGAGDVLTMSDSGDGNFLIYWDYKVDEPSLLTKHNANTFFRMAEMMTMGSVGYNSSFSTTKQERQPDLSFLRAIIRFGPRFPTVGQMYCLVLGGSERLTRTPLRKEV
jgi:hypothetical protein